VSPLAQPKKTAPGIVAIIVLAVGSAAALAYYAYARAHHAADGPVTVSSDNLEGVAWDAAADPPVVIARAGADGEHEDFVGPFWKAKKGESRHEHTLFVGVFDGATHERSWYAGPFGRGADARRWTHFGFARGRVVVADPHGVFHAFDVTTGEERFAVKLPGKARGLCAPPDSPTEGAQVWVDVDKGEGVTVDLVNGALTPAPRRPAWCAAPSPASACASYRGRATCGGPEEAPPVAGFKAERILVDLGDGIALGTSGDAAKPTSTVVGFDHTGGAVRFQINTASDAVTNALGVASSVAELRDGKLYAQYALKDTRWRLASFDAKTGQRLWDVVVPGTKHGDEARSIVVSRSRLYLSHGDWLDVFDLKTGGALGEFGR
jgi:outer membrane protein assembly factor BamB